MKLQWQRTVYSDGSQEYPAVYVRWDDVTAYLGRHHEGDPDQDARLVQGLLESGAPDWVQDAPGWIDEHGWGLYRAGRARLPYQVIEDNGGGLHLAVFSADSECIWYASGYEYIPDNLREDIAALQDGADPLQDGWESYLPDGYTPQQLYNELTSYEYGWEIIADESDTYPERMGSAGRTAFGAEKRYLTKDNNTNDHWGRCFWCNTISHEAMIEYDDNGEPICPECKRAGAMVKL